jgi:hypothetical protein
VAIASLWATSSSDDSSTQKTESKDKTNDKNPDQALNKETKDKQIDDGSKTA